MIIQLENVSVAFGKHIVLKDIKLEINEGEFVSLVGETGAGKTTLLRLLYFDLLPTVGTVRVGLFSSSTIRKREIPQLRQLIGVAFQDIKLLDDRNVYENIAFVLEVTKKKQDFIKERTEEILTEVGLNEKSKMMPNELSGGEQRRAVIARALANKPEVLLADEPTGDLDPQSANEILAVLKAINKKDTTVIMASHNHDSIKQAGGRVLQLKGGKLIE